MRVCCFIIVLWAFGDASILIISDFPHFFYIHTRTGLPFVQLAVVKTSVAFRLFSVNEEWLKKSSFLAALFVFILSIKRNFQTANYISLSMF